MSDNSKPNLRFTDPEGSFTLNNPNGTGYLYFPLANEAGVMSAISPILSGDMKTGQNTFFLEPASVEDLHNRRSSRNFWIYNKNTGAWSITGNSAAQISEKFSNECSDECTIEAGFLWHKVTNTNRRHGLRAEIINFVPANNDPVELMMVTVTNITDRVLDITPTAAIPIYARSADNLRDHRHVTSLLNRIELSDYGISVKPVLSFDELGHKENRVKYSIYGSDGGKPIGFFPVLETFIGEGGSLDWPETVIKNNTSYLTETNAGIDGYEAIGGIRFADISLKPSESASYVICMATEQDCENDNFAEKYCTKDAFCGFLEQNKLHWKKKLDTINFKSNDNDFDLWVRWVSVQPILRRIYGCSFLPHHDYGRGGRGWRDLWQDCLALLMMEPDNVGDLLYNNCAGIRIDGTNATVIGSKPGEFKADRNNIPRVWMDHAAWPFMTILLYINRSGDFDILFKKQTYFKDSFTKRTKSRDSLWNEADGNLQKTADGDVYEGTVLEHVILQNLTQFYNAGEHNNIALEGGDWNDAFDMADHKGESVAFSAFYSGNLIEIGNLLKELKNKKNITTLEVFEEMEYLINPGTDYESATQKLGILNGYYDKVSHVLSGKRTMIGIEQLSTCLIEKGNKLKAHISNNEFIMNSEGFEWFNGYYDNDGQRVEGDSEACVRMTLTGQVFPIMHSAADESQVEKCIKAVNRYLKDDNIGYRLNSNFGGLQQNIGRAFGFAFGHKENGSMFSHMTVMYANALYKRGFAKEGHTVLSSVYDLCKDFETSRIYPGIPEYINQNGRGMYHYLTGSASWFLLTMLNEVYGIKGCMGDLKLEPKLVKQQFDRDNKAAVHTLFAGVSLEIIFKNPAMKEYGSYKIGEIKINGDTYADTIIPRGIIQQLPKQGVNIIEVELI